MDEETIQQKINEVAAAQNTSFAILEKAGLKTSQTIAIVESWAQNDKESFIQRLKKEIDPLSDDAETNAVDFWAYVHQIKELKVELKEERARTTGKHTYIILNLYANQRVFLKKKTFF